MFGGTGTAVLLNESVFQQTQGLHPLRESVGLHSHIQIADITI